MASACSRGFRGGGCGFGGIFGGACNVQLITEKRIKGGKELPQKVAERGIHQACVDVSELLLEVFRGSRLLRGAVRGERGLFGNGFRRGQQHRLFGYI